MQGAIEKDFLNLLSAHCTTEKGVRQYTLFLRAIGAAGAQLPYKQKVTSSNLVSPTIYFRALYNARFLFWALSSAGEHHLHTVGVAGSNPVSPTKIKTFALKGKGFLLWAYDGYSSPKVRVQEKRIPLYQAGSLIFVHPIRDSSGSEAERRNPVFPTERRDTKTFLFSFPDSDMSHGKRTAIKNCLRNSFCLCISHQGAI